MIDRRAFIHSAAALAGVPLAEILGSGLPVWLQEMGDDPAGGRGPASQSVDFEPIEKSEEEWRRILTDEEFAVLRDEDTEPAHSSPLNRERRDGTFICAGCFLPLFGGQVHERHGVAQLHPPHRRGSCGHQAGLEADPSPDRVSLCALRGTPGTRLRRRSAAHREAVLQQRGGSGLRAEG